MSEETKNPHPNPALDRELAARIDHTLLKADASSEEIAELCSQAKQYGFATVCVNSSRIPLAARELAGSKTLPIAVVGFPLGAMETEAKAFEARRAVALGAREIDMVINLGCLKENQDEAVRADIAAVVQASKPYPVKVILETSLLNEEQKIRACQLSKEAGAAFVKTSTGFANGGRGGATAEDIALMRKTVDAMGGTRVSVKASGGIRTREDALKMIAAGADRIGASSSVAIVTNSAKSGTGY